MSSSHHEWPATTHDKNTENSDSSRGEIIIGLEEIKQELSQWKVFGSSAKVWNYGVSFSRLQIRIEKVGHPHNLIVTCQGTLSIRGDLAWDNAAFEITHRSISSIFEGKPVTISWLVLQDVQAGFEVLCAKIFAHRDVEPIYRSDNNDDTE